MPLNFIKKARTIHGNRYDYNKITEPDDKGNVIIGCKVHGDFTRQAYGHLQGQHCTLCNKISRVRRLGKDFIAKSSQIHGSYYNYNLVRYLKASEKVDITCPKHGTFQQRPSCHLAGAGCKQCGKDKMSLSKRSTTAEFVEKARSIHGSLYSYVDATYTGNENPLTIACSQHGPFTQTPAVHLKGSGCQKCSYGKPRTKEWFVQKAIEVHGLKFDYSETVYSDIRGRVKVRCRHGVFHQRASDHLSGSIGCTFCSNEAHWKDTNQFVAEARDRHGDLYDYSLAEYIGGKRGLTIVCREHGQFTQIAANHINGSHCPKCTTARAIPTYVYVMDNKLGQVKIGFSVNVLARSRDLNNVQKFNSKTVYKIKVSDGVKAQRIERRVHKLFANKNSGLRGFDGATEWFNVTATEAISAIKCVAQEVNGEIPF